MAIYIGGQKFKLIVGGDICDMQIYSPTPITNGVRLLSSDDYTLKDINGLYLTTKKEDE
jgi:hypothetical protein